MNLESLHELIDIADTHGLSMLLLLALLFMYLIPRFKKLEKRAELKADDTEHMEAIVRLEKEIIAILAQVANEVGCQSAVLWQFHNGTYSTYGIPFIFMSITHEFSVPNFTPRADLYQKIPQSVFIDVIEQLLEHHYVRLDRKMSSAAIKNSYIRDGVECGYGLRVNGANSKMIGILCVTFSKKRVLKESQIVALQGYSARISMLLAEMKAYYNKPEGCKTIN